MRQIGIALHDYHEAHTAFPSGTVVLTCVPPERRLSWLATLLPHMDQDPVYRDLDVSTPCNFGPNAPAMKAPIRAFLCPGIAGQATENSPGLTHYVGVAGLGTDAAELCSIGPEAGFFGYDRRLTLADIKDGTSCTLAVIESEAANGSWLGGGRGTVRGLDSADQPYIRIDGPFGAKHLSDSVFRTHPVLANAAFADASVRPLNSTISASVLEALVTVAGGETIDESY